MSRLSNYQPSNNKLSVKLILIYHNLRDKNGTQTALVTIIRGDIRGLAAISPNERNEKCNEQ